VLFNLVETAAAEKAVAFYFCQETRRKMSTEAQIAANQANAQLSTGPVTAEGRAIVSKNALKTGLTGRTVLLPSDDAERYEKHIQSFRARFNPVGDSETELVQSMADSHWRLARIPGLEAGIFAVGFVKLGHLHVQEKDEQRRIVLIEAEVMLAYERQLRNLQTQESRLRRNIEKDIQALTKLQEARKAEQGKRLTEAARLLITAIKNGQARSFNPSEIGFEFSIAEIEKHAAKIEPQLLAAYNASKPRHLRNQAA
jgi:hypothetical protein